MKNHVSLTRLWMTLFLLTIAYAIALYPKSVHGQTANRYDVTNYRIEAQLDPAQHTLRAGADVTFVPETATRSVVFELNGSLHVDGVEKDGHALTGVVQDAVGNSALGPNVRIDLGAVVPEKQPVTIRVRWSGALISPEGGPWATKRLAYVGMEGSYLMYAARWFPFHDYSADRATSDITVIVPTGMQVGGVSDEPVVPQVDTTNGTTRFRFISKQPVLVGNFVAGQYVTKSVRFGNYEVQFFVKPGSENHLDNYTELIGRTLEFYTKEYGAPSFGTRLVVAQTDEETIEAYSGSGIVFLATHFFDTSRPTQEERLQREIAYQWWGQSVGLKSFDDAALSQGLAEWSAFSFRQSILTGAALDATQREEQEQALTFEQTASIARAPSALDDQSAAYQSIVFYKSAAVFRMLRETIGKEAFGQLLRRFLEQYRGKNVSLDDFERLTSQVAGQNMRYFFAQWVEGTGVPEFSVDYQIIRTRAGKFRTRGTVKQTQELRMPVDLTLHFEGGTQDKIVQTEGKSEDFDFESSGLPIKVIVDPNSKILHMSDDLKIAIVARRGIELFREGQYAEAQQQLEAALKLDRNNAWVYYNLGLTYFQQKNWQLALDNFQAAIDSVNDKPAWIEAWAHIKRGNSYDARGDRARAVAEYNKALQNGSNYDNAQTVAKQYLSTPFDPKSTASE